MNVFLPVLISVIVLTFPYVVMLVILSCYSWKHGLTLKALMTKYSKARRLFGVMLGWQLVSLVLTALAGTFAVFIHRGPAVTLANLLPGVVSSVIILELGFLAVLMDFDVTDTFDYISKDLHNLHNQSIKI